MPSFRVGVVVRWRQVETVVVAMLLQLGHRPVGADAADGRIPDLVVRDASREPSAGWRDLPEVVLSGSAVGVMIETAGKVRVGKPFSLEQLQEAIRLSYAEVE